MTWNYASMFAGAGGSSEGYRRLGWRTVGAIEIDPKQAVLYEALHDVKPIQSDIRTVEFPAEFYGLDVIDGSPPCTMFSTARSQGFSKDARSYAEGKIVQRLDDLIYIYARRACELRPRWIVLENVQGLLRQQFKGILNRIALIMRSHGYTVSVALLHGREQRRPRVFVIGGPHEVKIKSQKTLTLGEILKTEHGSPLKADDGEEVNKKSRKYLLCRKAASFGMSSLRDITAKKSLFNHSIAYLKKPIPTISANGPLPFIAEFDRHINRRELHQAFGWPWRTGWGTLSMARLQYALGMAVLPSMAAHVGQSLMDSEK